MAGGQGKLKKWGNSLGIVISKDIVEMEKLKEGQNIEYIVMKPNNVLKETFGSMKGKIKQSSQEIKDELRKELYDKD